MHHSFIHLPCQHLPSVCSLQGTMLAPCDKHVRHRERTEESKGGRDKRVNTSLHDSIDKLLPRQEQDLHTAGKAQRDPREQGPEGGRCCRKGG